GVSPKQLELAHWCNRSRMAYFRFDHRGCGSSSGDFDTVTSLAGRKVDLEMAATLVRRRTDTGQGICLFGSSLGGAVCLAAAEAIRPDRIVTIAAPIRSRSILDARGGDLSIPDGFRKPHLQFDLTDRLAGISGLLIVHGDRDETIPVSQALELHRRVSAPKELIINEGGDHRMSRRDHQLRFLKAATQWFISSSR
ncbi:MAG: alpha/beta hydrolase, partial [Desulfobacterales bacterium]